ncbi:MULTISPECIES: divergent PAP2 family protein [Planococcus]|uniref:Acid phosphatase n=1 Tax=Planococcus rifietoensis TaxID=200991 RepID=A0A0U2ZBD4_9BACL|nr:MULTISPECIES: divergent PAP2 family protein [Planococcus]ALS76540.1 acid phosphatase [Planococcus rifietoensis]AUD14393.1 divergent PAP2 family protein [Planococcus sp. MB-3u-03]MDE0582742.1 divergent PAP2 family protein [Planococcus sp. A6]PKG46695.1 divergent PAP2 family protein [Planococcus sp. Urea-trap-24]PKG89452.1 divergent PAP2 family protein [Planococcus sp. Urea-3u-39]
MRKMNRGMITSLGAIGIAQGLKIVTHKVVAGKWDWQQAFTTGGMPSSHSAGVSALAAYVASNKGARHTETALAVVFGAIVMYDAQGIRRHTGEIARLVNDLEDSFTKISGEFPSFEFVERDKELKELLGHQPIEVAAGAAFGTLLGIIAAKIENRERDLEQQKRLPYNGRMTRADYR